MPTNVTESEAFTANVPVPDDTEDANHAGLLAMVQPLTNRTKFINARFWNYKDGGTFTLTAPSTLASAGSNLIYSGGTWQYDGAVIDLIALSKIQLATGSMVDLSGGGRIRQKIVDGPDLDHTYLAGDA